jgi:hypothetical protein
MHLDRIGQVLVLPIIVPREHLLAPWPFLKNNALISDLKEHHKIPGPIQHSNRTATITTKDGGGAWQTHPRPLPLSCVA